MHRTRPITVKGITGLQITDRFANFDVLIGPDSNIKLEVSAYVVKGLAPGLLVGMDTLVEQDAVLHLSQQIMTIKGKNIQLTYAESANSLTAHHTITAVAMFEIFRERRAKWSVLDTTLHAKQTPWQKHKKQLTRTSGNLSGCETAKTSESCELGPLQITAKSVKTAIQPVSPTSNPNPNTCRRCSTPYASKRRLHNHLRHCKTEPRRRRLDEPWRKS